MLICLGLMLMLAVRFSASLTPQTRVILLQVSCFIGLFFLLCTQQWIYALILAGYMWDLYDHSFARWLEQPADRCYG